MTDNLLKTQAFKLKGRLYTLTVLQILDTKKSIFAQHLIDVISKAPRMFEKTPIVLDVSDIQQNDLDLQYCCQALREQGMIPVAVQGADARLQTIAMGCGLALLGASSLQDKPLFEEVVDPKMLSVQTKLVTNPVRSGQQVVSLGGDLVIVSSVGHGAELLAEGNIHVYGALRGRALAGIDGNKQVRIFCHSLDAELVSIAGFYRLRDEIEPPAGPCQIYLQDEHIVIESL